MWGVNKVYPETQASQHTSQEVELTDWDDERYQTGNNGVFNVKPVQSEEENIRAKRRQRDKRQRKDADKFVDESHFVRYVERSVFNRRQAWTPFLHQRKA